MAISFASRDAAFALDATSVAIRCGAVRRADGRRFVPPSFVRDLMTPAEIQACLSLVRERGRDARLCVDPELSDELASLFERRLAMERFASMQREMSRRHRAIDDAEDRRRFNVEPLSGPGASSGAK